MRKILFVVLVVLATFVSYGAKTDYVAQNGYESFEQVQSLAETGDAQAMRVLAQCYNAGVYVEKDSNQAMLWFSRSAEAGDPEGMFLLGHCYYYGKNVEQNYAMAVKWYQKATDADFGRAMNQLGSCYHHGYGVPIDPKRAFELYLQASSMGEQAGMNNLAYCYEKGFGTEVNLKAALNWYTRSASYDDAASMNQLGNMYMEGRGVDVDLNKGLEWYKRAALKGNKTAMLNLARCYMEGKGVELDLNEAWQWAVRAEKRGHKKAAAFKDKIIAAGFNPDSVELPQDGKKAEMAAETDIEIPKAPVARDNTFAIIWANENYVNLPKAEYAINDGTGINEYITKTLGVPEENIRFVTDATYIEMRRLIDWISAVSEAFDGDINVILYYAGHGTCDETTRQGCLIPVDGSATNTELCLSIEDVNQLLSNVPANKMVMILDAAFNGELRGGAIEGQSRGVAIAPRKSEPMSQMVMMMAAKDSQSAYLYPQQGHGLFTYFLLKKLQETHGDVTLGELADYVTAEVNKRALVTKDKEQQPMVVPSSDLDDDWHQIKF